MIAFNEDQLERAKELLATIPDGVERAAASALNRAVEHAKTQAMRKVRQTYTIKLARIDARLQIQKATRSSLFASIRNVGRPIALSYFTIRPNHPATKRTKKIVYAQVRRDGGSEIRKAFVARMKSGHDGVFRRTDGNQSLPISEFYGPSLPQMLGSPTVSTFVTEAATNMLQVRLEHEVSRLLKE